MRKLYTLVWGLIVLVTTKTNSQPNIDPRDIFLETSNITVTTTVNDEINETCQANFEVSGEASSPLTKKFIAQPWHSEQKRPVYICWKFGDGNDTCIQYSNTNPGPYTVVHHYQKQGVYEVCVKIVYAGGCEAAKCKLIYITVPDVCRADFEKLLITPGITSLEAIYQALPWHNNNKKPKKICWTFGDGRDTCVEYPVNYTGSYLVKHKYRQARIYQVCIKILYDGDCVADKCKQVQVGRRDECKVDFERLPIATTNNPLVAIFKALPWHSNNKKPKTIHWNFGDGRDTIINYTENYTGPYNVKHVFREPGNYQVCLKITYFGGCDSYICKHIQIGEPDRCGADFERIPNTSTNDLLVIGFNAIASHNNNKVPKVICWSFGDGKDTCIEYAQNFSGPYAVRHRYNVPGTYTVCVKIIYYGGCEAKKCNQIVVTRPDECRADFERIPINPTANPLLVYFKALPWNNNNKKPKTICWRLGDGRDTCINYPENYTGAYAVSHRYNQPGHYEVCIKISYYGGCEAYKCKTIQVGEIVQCKADFERIPISSVNDPLNVAFKAIPGHIENKKPIEICWKFGDGKDTCIQYGEDYSGSYVVHHRYDRPGNYEVCVKSTYYGGCEAKKCEVIKVEAPGECRVKLFELTPSITSLVRGFFASTWSSENKGPMRVCWYFGDGTDTCVQLSSGISLTQLFIRHTYPAPGEYKACVKVLFEGGCIASDCDEVIIRPTTNACGGYMTDSLISPRTFKFRGFAIHNPDDPVVGYRWTFGDGSAATGKEVTHQYNVPGTYEVCLTIKTQRGCETKICKPLHVPGNAQVALEITPNPVINIMHVLFYSTLSEPVMIRVLNGYGIVVKTWSRNATQGANNWDLDVSTLPAGPYTLYVQSSNQLASRLFIKAN